MNNPFGVLDFIAWDHDWNGHHYSLEDVRRSARLMRAAGIGFVRMDFLWSDLEPRKGTFNFSKYDQRVKTLTREGLSVLGVLNYNPAWRSGLWSRAPVVRDYQRYAVAVVRHFCSRVKHWEVWNEPDHPVYWQPQDGLRAYGKLLKAVYPALKRADPDCTVLMGGLSIPGNLRQVYKHAGRKSFDIVNIHPFTYPLVKNPLHNLRRLYGHTRRIMKQFGDEKKPIWFTEIGCPGVPHGKTVAPWWMGKNPSEKQQAAWVKKVYTSALHWPGVEKIFWAFFRDTPAHFKDGVDYLGLVRQDFSPKAAYHVFKSITTEFSK